MEGAQGSEPTGDVLRSSPLARADVVTRVGISERAPGKSQPAKREETNPRRASFSGGAPWLCGVEVMCEHQHPITDICAIARALPSPCHASRLAECLRMETSKVSALFTSHVLGTHSGRSVCWGVL